MCCRSPANCEGPDRTPEEELPTNQHYSHFSIERLGEGIYAAIAAPEGSLMCNSAIVELTDGCLVMDTGATLAAARELRLAAEALTGKPVTSVINSHAHPDHVNGNREFLPGADLIAAKSVRAEIAADGLRWLEQMRGETGGNLAGYPSPADIRVPSVSFTSELTFHEPGRTVRLIAYEGAHSWCDTVLFVPEERLLFCGDLLTDGNLVLPYGDPDRWLRALEDLVSLGPETVVPGHGLIAPAEVALWRARGYIEGLVKQVSDALSSHADGPATVPQLPVPDGCGAHWWEENIRFLTKRLRGDQAAGTLPGGEETA